MKALVTGASGFIGSHLVESLREQGHSVRTLLRKTSQCGYLDGLAYERCEGDLGDIESLKRAVAGVDCVFHVAGTVAAQAKKREDFFRNNVDGTVRMAEAVAAANPGLRRFVYVSSLAAGGPSPGRVPRSEEDLDLPVSIYGESKKQSETALLKFRDQFRMTIIRPPIVYGPRERDLFTAVETVARGLMPILPGSGEHGGDKFYSAVHVKDLCQGMILASEAESVASGEIFYLAHPQVFTYQELLQTIATALGGRKPLRIRLPMAGLIVAAATLSALGKVTNKTFPLNLDKLKEIRPHFWICSSAKAEKLLRFSPKRDLATGMRNAIEWYREKNWL